MFLLFTTMIRQQFLALALLGSLVLTGCSAVKFGYEQVPSLLYWWLDAYVDFTEVQAGPTRQALQRLQQWHRQRELPQYADVLARVATMAEGPIQAEQVCQTTRELRQRLDVLLQEAIGQMGPVVAQIDARQIRHLSQHLVQKNAEWEEQWLQGPPGAPLQRRLDKAVDRYADFYGNVTPAQTALLRQQLEQSVWTPQWGRQERLRQQHDLLAVLMRVASGKLSASAAEQALLDMWARWWVPASTSDQQRWQAWQAQACKNLAELHNSTSAQQRQRAARRLRAYERDLRELAARS